MQLIRMYLWGGRVICLGMYVQDRMSGKSEVGWPCSSFSVGTRNKCVVNSGCRESPHSLLSECILSSSIFRSSSHPVPLLSMAAEMVLLSLKAGVKHNSLFDLVFLGASTTTSSESSSDSDWSRHPGVKSDPDESSISNNTGPLFISVIFWSLGLAGGLLNDVLRNDAANVWWWGTIND